MSKADTVAFEYARTLSEDYNQIYDAVKYGYHQAVKDLASNKDNIMDLLKKKKVQALQDKDDAIEKHDNNSTANADYYSGVAAGLTKAIEIIGMLDKGNKAEKDLALTWEDVQTICKIESEVDAQYCKDGVYSIPIDDVYKEVLRRFNELKGYKV